MKRIAFPVLALALITLCGCGGSSYTDAKVTVYSNDKIVAQYTSDGEVHLSNGFYYFNNKNDGKEIDVSGTVTVEYQ